MGARRPPLVLLSLAAALSPFGMAIVLPMIGGIATRFDTGPAGAQFVISVYLFGLGIMQPLAGALCDRIGRRPVLIGGVALFTLASVGCALAGNLATLVAFRGLQAIGVSVGTVGSRAVIRDTCDPLETMKALAVLAAAMGLAPVIAPVIGGSLGALAGPGTIFLVTASLGLLATGWLFVALPETRGAPPVDHQPGRGGIRSLLTSPPFMGNTLLYGFVQGAFFAFLAVGAPLFEAAFGLGQAAFGTIWGLMGLAYVGGAAAAGHAARRIGAFELLRAGATLGTLAGTALLADAVIGGPSLPIMIGALTALMVAGGVIMPTAMAGAISGEAALAGRAAGLSSAIGLGMSGMFSVVAGLVYTGDFRPVALFMAAAGYGTLAVLPWVRTAVRG